jgi:hypothetical protein
MTAPRHISIVGTAIAGWRFVASDPVAALRVGWLPAFLAAWLPTIELSGFASSIFATRLMIAFGGFAFNIVALVAWQRMVLYGTGSRKGWLPFRLGRAELISILHFPLAGFLYMPLQATAMVSWAVTSPEADRIATWLPWAGFAVLVFPGGLLLARAALMLPAIAAAGSARASLVEVANRVWRLGTGNTVRLWLALVLAAAPLTLAVLGLGALQPVVAERLPGFAMQGLNGVLITLYLLVVGGVYADSWRTLGGVDRAKPKPRRRRR